MKKFYLLLIAAAVAVTTDVSAQFVQTTPARQTNTTRETATSSSTTSLGSYQVNVGYNVANINWSSNQSGNEDALPIKHGVTIGFHGATGIDPSSSLLMDFGYNFGVFFGTYEESGYDTEVMMGSINVPIRLKYPLSVGSAVISPYCGLNFRFNLAGWWDTSIDGLGSVNMDLFDEDDMGDTVFRRFQTGFNYGVEIAFGTMSIGISHVSDFSKIVDSDLSGKFGVTTISLASHF